MQQTTYAYIRRYTKYTSGKLRISSVLLPYWSGRDTTPSLPTDNHALVIFKKLVKSYEHSVNRKMANNISEMITFRVDRRNELITNHKVEVKAHKVHTISRGQKGKNCPSK